MFLRQLTLKGFKSFAETTVLTLEPGVTVVVGPNGSGKSNVVDAIAWVLGAQAPSAVRSQKMDDVIFAGTAKRPALGRAEVSLTIDNTNGLLPIEFTEVTLTRTLWRSGDSEYAINGVPCRLLDVQELLSDSGVGRQQHVIVGQGQIDAVLNARPEDRRAVIEEAAGVLKYRKRKERAERRLDATEASLLRVQDLLREVRRQLRPLERQAEAARRHGEVVAELTALRVHVAGREIAGLQRRLEGLAVEERDLRQQDESVRRDLARMDTEVLAAEARLSASGASDLGDLLVRVEQLRERARGLTAVLHERRRSLERDRVQLMDASVAASLEAEAARLRSEQAAVAEAQAALEPDVAALEADEEAAAARRAPAADDDLRRRHRRDDGTAGQPDTTRAARAAAEVRGELHARRSAHQADEERLARAEAALAALGERHAALDGAVEAARTRFAQAEEAEAPLLTALEAAQAAHTAALTTAEAAGAARAAAAERHTEWSARADALALALDAARARAGAEHLSDVDGALGTLLDLVEIDPGWEAAAEAALGEALAAVVVTDAGAARRALDHLDQVDVGGGVLAAAGPPPAPAAATPGAPRPRPRPRRRPDRRRPARPAAPAGRRGGRAVGRRLGRRPRPPVRRRRHPQRRPVLGHRLPPGPGRRRGHGLRARRGPAPHGGGRDRAGRDRRPPSLPPPPPSRRRRPSSRPPRRGSRPTTSESARAAATLERLQRERQEVGEALERGRAEHEAGQERAGAGRGRHRRPRAGAGRPRGRRGDRGRRRPPPPRGPGAGGGRGPLARRPPPRPRRPGGRHRGAGHDGRQPPGRRRAPAGRGRPRAGRRGRPDRAHRARRRRRRAPRRAGGPPSRGHRRPPRPSCRTSAAARPTRPAAASLALEHLRRERAEAERRLAEIAERQRRAEIAEAEARTRLEAAVEHVRRELDTEPGAAVAAPAPPLAEGVTPAARVRDLEREIRLMGPINPLALEEFTALQERHRFLEEQLEDVRSTRRDLQRVIRSVDAEIQSVFAAAFADVSESFTALFATLFPGGTGRLILTDPDDLLSTGIEVEAKPSGKNVKKLSLLSGGERSLTALAFLFAVFRSRPSPFYVMDEVEAALDDVNLHRFLGLIAEFRADAQLLVVSHQKRTMEAGDCLIGVTMQPGGSSKVITERVTRPGLIEGSDRAV